MKKLLNEIISLLRLNTGKANLKVALLCLVTATLFWFFNALNKDYTTNVRYPITFLYDSDSYQAVEELPEDVLLNMSGVGWNLLRNSLGLNVQPIQILIDNPEGNRFITGASLPTAITDQITDLQLNYVLTDTLYLSLDRRINRYAKLEVNQSAISLSEGYALAGPVIISPDSVRLTGPREVLMSLGDSIMLEITDAGIDENYDDEIEIEIPRKDLISRNPPTATVSFMVEEISQVDLELPLELVNFPEDVLIADTLVSVSVFCRNSLLSGISVEDFTARLDFNDIDQSDSTLLPSIVRFPANLENVIMDSTRVKPVWQ